MDFLSCRMYVVLLHGIDVSYFLQVRLQLDMQAPVTASTARVGDSLPLASSSTPPTLPASPPGHEPLLLLQLTDVDELVRIAEDLEVELLASYRRYDQVETLLAHEHEVQLEKHTS